VPAASSPAPPRYKMAIILSVIGHWLNLLPTLERTLVITALMVTLMTYVSRPA
jgi:antibiotic biosynthesis monooxygenase (ABM) superfamily enzyme